MAHRHVGAATPLCHIPLRPSLYCISLPYPSAAHAAAARRAFPLAAGGTGHAPSGARAACRTPACAGCALLLHWLRAGKLGRATNLRLLRLGGCRINLRSRLASPARFNLHGHSSRLALPLSLVPCPLAAQASASLAGLRHALAAWLCRTLPRCSTASVLATRRVPSATLPSVFCAKPAWAQAGHSGAKPPPLHTSGKHIGLCRLITSPQRQRQAASGSPMPPVRHKLLVRHAQHNRMQASQSALPT